MDEWSFDELMGLAEGKGDICSECGEDMPSKGKGYPMVCDECLGDLDEEGCDE